MALFACKVGSTEGSSAEARVFSPNGRVESGTNVTVGTNFNTDNLYVIPFLMQTSNTSASPVLTGANALVTNISNSGGSSTYNYGYLLIKPTSSTVVLRSSTNSNVLCKGDITEFVNAEFVNA